MKRVIALVMIVFIFRPVFGQPYATVTAELYHDSKTGMEIGGGPSISIGGKFNFLHAGFGGSVLFLTQGTGKPYAPVFAELIYMEKKKISPYGGFRVGYGFYNGPGTLIEHDENVKGGFYFSPSAGATFKLTKDIYILTSLGISFMQFHITEYRQSGQVENVGTFRNLPKLNVGLRF